MAGPSLRAAPIAVPGSRLSLRHLLNVPNILTLCRLLAIPILLACLSKERYTYALYIFGLAAITDALDGTIARLYDCKTEIG
ncbi:MAG: CDP-alcohol phosphatidyltransferase family protein, partial [Candidatus Binataceae bacterium]